jgi:multiple sugar transport system permease protein
VKRRHWAALTAQAVLIAGSAVFLLPAYWLVLTSFKAPAEIHDRRVFMLPGALNPAVKAGLEVELPASTAAGAAVEPVARLTASLNLPGRRPLVAEILYPPDRLDEARAWNRRLVSDFSYPEERILLREHPGPLRLREAKHLFWNYRQALNIIPVVRYFANSVLILTYTLLGCVLTAAICGYGFARFRAPGSGIIFGAVLATLMLPDSVTMIPVFMLFKKIGWINTFKPLIIPAWFGGGAFSIFLMRQFFLTIPRELDEAARLDGATEWQIFWHVMLPLAKPALAAIAVFTFFYSWNDFMGPLIYLHDTDKYNLALGLNMFRGQYVDRVPWGPLMAASAMMSVPMVIVFFVAQRHFVKGVTMTGIKG